MARSTVIGIAELRQSLPTIVRAVAGGQEVLVGSHRKPQVVLRAFPESDSKPNLADLKKHARIISTLAKGCGLSTVFVTGSVATGTSNEDSDIDLICEGTAATTLYDIAAFETVMEDLMGHPVTALLKSSLDPVLDEALLSKAVQISW